MFNIYTATERDVPLIVGIAEKTWWRAYRNIISDDQIRYMLRTIYGAEILKQQIGDDSQTYLIGEDQEGTQGFASYAKRSEDPSVFKLHKLYIAPEGQGKGLGKALINEIKVRLLKYDFHTLDLNVNRLNPALKFYQHLGFSIIREEDIPIGDFWMNDYVLRLEF